MTGTLPDTAPATAGRWEELPAGVREYVDGGVGDTPQRNLTAWDDWRLRPRMLRDVTSVDLSVELLGHRLAHPVLAAPTAGHLHLHPEGEVATARGVAAADAVFSVSMSAGRSVEDVAAVAGPFLQQVYLPADRDLVRPFLARSVAAGAFGLLLTVDGPAVGYGFGFRAGLVHVPGRRSENFPEVDPSRLVTTADTSAQDIGRLADLTGLPVLVKGVLRADDARTAVAAGAAGVVVSNHGGRQLGGSVATAHVLSEVVDAVGSEVPVLVDGGIRRPEDVVRALALGARAVLVGRPVARATVGGARAVETVVRDLAEGTRVAMTMCGAASVADLDADLLVTDVVRRAPADG